ncbi:hypothetical protein E2C01_087641 [Portunus trituberculatus]|uniref:Uncharacterized protein n=1 Tax=Portunus trituberculatus TaxID=210409 RepID=A0A5B7JEL6_PORTR|nr:hypothetical protein [Portunus trituberculatus]
MKNNYKQPPCAVVHRRLKGVKCSAEDKGGRHEPYHGAVLTPPPPNSPPGAGKGGTPGAAEGESARPAQTNGIQGVSGAARQRKDLTGSTKRTPSPLHPVTPHPGTHSWGDVSHVLHPFPGSVSPTWGHLHQLEEEEEEEKEEEEEEEEK